MSTSRPKYLPWVVFAAIGAGIAVYFLDRRLAYPFDDTFITFRYAKNLAQGFGFVWNHGGAHTEGYTNFLFVILLAVAERVHLDLLLTSQWIGSVSLIVSAVLAYRIGRSLATPLVGWVAGLLVLLDPFMWVNAMSGMETNLFVLFVLAAWAAYSRGAIRAAYTAAVLAALTRPEGAVLAGILFVLQWRQAGVARAFRSALTFAVPITLYAVWKLWYFGDLLPNSFYVKVVQVREGSSALLLPGLGAVKHFYMQNVLLVLIALAGVVYARRKNARDPFAFGWAWVVIMSAFYSASYLLMGKYDRFTLSIEAVLLVLFVVGACSLLARIRWRWLVWVGVIAAFWFTEYRARGAHDLLHVHDDPNAAYQTLGEAIAQMPGHEHILIASADAGVLPFYSDAQHFDLVGLNTNSVARATSADRVLALAAAAKPDVILVPVRRDSADSCMTVYREGHGLIGAHYMDIVSNPAFSAYHSIGRLDIGYYEVDLLANTTSSYYAALVAGTRPLLSQPTACYR